MSSLIDQMSQHGVAIVFVNVLVQQLGAPLPALPTVVVAASLAARGRLSVPSLFAAAMLAIFGRGLDVVLARTALRPPHAELLVGLLFGLLPGPRVGPRPLSPHVAPVRQAHPGPPDAGPAPRRKPWLPASRFHRLRFAGRSVVVGAGDRRWTAVPRTGRTAAGDARQSAGDRAAVRSARAVAACSPGRRGNTGSPRKSQRSEARATHVVDIRVSVRSPEVRAVVAAGSHDRTYR